jgi:hypothetical protein
VLGSTAATPTEVGNHAERCWGVVPTGCVARRGSAGDATVRREQGNSVRDCRFPLLFYALLSLCASAD